MRADQRQFLVHRRVQGLHHRLAERGDDAQPAVRDLLGGVVVGVLQLVHHRVHDVAAVTRPVVVERLDGLGELLCGRFALGQPAFLHHRVEHVVPAVDQCLVGSAPRGVRAVVARELDHRSDHGSLGDGELAHRDPEVRLGRRAEAVDPGAGLHRVHVLGEDPLLGLELGQLFRDEDLLDLPAGGLRGADPVVVVPHQFLGDGGAALLDRAAGQVGDGGADDPGERDPALVVEVLVLGGHHDVLDHDRYLVRHQDLPVRAAEHADQRVAVPVVDLGGLPGGELRGDRDRCLGEDEVEADNHDHDEPAAGGQGQDHGFLPGPVTPPVTLTARPPGTAAAAAAAPAAAAGPAGPPGIAAACRPSGPRDAPAG